MPTPLPKGLIDKGTAQAMEKLYVENQYAAINQNNVSHGDHEPDSRETTFALDEIENYITYVKQMSEEQGLKDLGIRVYQGAKKEADGKIFTTVFFAPTNEGKNSMDILCLNLGTYGRPPTNY